MLHVKIMHDLVTLGVADVPAAMSLRSFQNGLSEDAAET
jgi:hypothetical protein